MQLGNNYTRKLQAEKIAIQLMIIPSKNSLILKKKFLHQNRQLAGVGQCCNACSIRSALLMNS